MTTPMDRSYYNSNPAEDAPSGSPPLQRKKLQLKPRSARPSRQRQSSSKRGSGLFGEALPREEILQKRGVDVQTIDSKFERKAALSHSYTPAQEERLEVVRAELEEAADALREANEKEMPEEVFRIAHEAKRKELNELMEEFAKANLLVQREREERYSKSGGRSSGAGGGGEPTSRRSSYGQRGGGGGGGGGGHHHGEDGETEGDRDDAYASFNTNRRRRPSDAQHA